MFLRGSNTRQHRSDPCLPLSATHSPSSLRPQSLFHCFACWAEWPNRSIPRHQDPALPAVPPDVSPRSTSLSPIRAGPSPASAPARPSPLQPSPGTTPPTTTRCIPCGTTRALPAPGTPGEAEMTDSAPAKQRPTRTSKMKRALPRRGGRAGRCACPSGRCARPALRPLPTR